MGDGQPTNPCPAPPCQHVFRIILLLKRCFAATDSAEYKPDLLFFLSQSEQIITIQELWSAREASNPCYVSFAAVFTSEHVKPAWLLTGTSGTTGKATLLKKSSSATKALASVIMISIMAMAVIASATASKAVETSYTSH